MSSGNFGNYVLQGAIETDEVFGDPLFGSGMVQHYEI